MLQYLQFCCLSLFLHDMNSLLIHNIFIGLIGEGIGVHHLKEFNKYHLHSTSLHLNPRPIVLLTEDWLIN